MAYSLCVCAMRACRFKGTSTKCKPSAAVSRLRAVREAADSQWETHTNYSRRTHHIALQGRARLYYRMARHRMLQ